MFFVIAVAIAVTDFHPYEINTTIYQHANCTGNYTVQINSSVGYCVGDIPLGVSCCDRAYTPPDPPFGACSYGKILTCYSDWVSPPAPPPEPSRRRYNAGQIATIVILVVILLLVLTPLCRYPRINYAV